MKLLSMLKRIAALGLLSASLGLAGCAGGGGSGSGGDPVSKAFGNGNFSGSFDEPSRSRSPQTACTIRFGSSNAGVASFVSGTPGDDTFRTYSADIQNVHFTPTNSSSGTMSFDMVNFTAGAPFASPLHYAGNYVYTSTPVTLQVTGTLTGNNKSGSPVSVSFGINYDEELAKNPVNLAGNYSGTIGLAGQDVPWTGSFTNSTLPLHLTASINTNLGPIQFTGQNARTSFAGSFDGGQINPLATGKTAQWYVESHDNGATIIGAYVIIDGDTGQPFDLGGVTFAGMIHGTRTTTGGGSASLKTGYYDGGIMRNGVLDGRIFKMDVIHSTSTVGANGAMVIVTNSSAPNIGGRVASVVTSGTTATITIDHITNTYARIVVTGTVSGNQLNNAQYTATLPDNSTETGTIDQLGKGTTVTSNFAGTWTGSLTGASGTPNSFTGTITQPGDGTLTVTTNSQIGGFTIPTINAYVAGSSFAGFDSVADLPSPLTGNSFRGDFDGDINGTHIAGTFIYAVTNNTSGNVLLSDAGSIALTKQ